MARYHMANGFHRTSTYVLVRPKAGEKVAEETMKRAFQRLCPYADCKCTSSMASDPHIPEGIAGHRELMLIPHTGEDWILCLR